MHDCGELEAGAAAVSLEQGVTALGGEMGLGPWAGCGETLGEARDITFLVPSGPEQEGPVEYPILLDISQKTLAQKVTV